MKCYALFECVLQHACDESPGQQCCDGTFKRLCPYELVNTAVTVGFSVARVTLLKQV